MTEKQAVITSDIDAGTHEWEPGDTPKGDSFDDTDTTPVACNNCDWEGLQIS